MGGPSAGSGQACATTQPSRDHRLWPLLLTATLSVICVVTTWQRASYGLDRTDEGLYLLLMRDPSVDPATTFLFGDLLHPLYAALRGDIVGLRRVGLVLSCALTALLFTAVSRRAGARRRAAVAHGVAACGAGALVMTLFPMTPSYNTVAFWGGLLVLTGLARALPTGRSTPACHGGAGRSRSWRTSVSASQRSEQHGGGVSRTAPNGDTSRRRRRITTSTLAEGSEPGGVGWALVGVGGVLAFVGKPTSAAALAVLAVIGLVLSGRPRGRALGSALLGLGAAALAFLAVSGRSPTVLAQTLTEGVRSTRLLRGHDDLVRLDPASPVAAAQAMIGQAQPVALQVLLLLTTAVIVALLVRSPLSSTDPADRAVERGSCTERAIEVETAAAPGSIASRRSDPSPVTHPRHERASSDRGPDSVSASSSERAGPGRQGEDDESHTRRVAPPATDFGGVNERPRSNRPPRSAARWTSGRRFDPDALLGMLLLLAPAAVVFGTNVNVWTSMGRLAAFWVAALVLLLPAHRWVAPITLTCITLAIVTAQGYTYRYTPIGPDAEKTVATSEGARVLLDPTDAADTRELLANGTRHGLAGAPILDTTGASPGYIHALGGRPVGSAWLLGGYPGSADAARHALSLEPCDRLAEALVLHAPRSPRRIDAIWTYLGVDPTDYRRLFTFRHVLGHDVHVLAPRAAPATCPD